MEKNKKDDIDAYDYLGDSCSSTDCTGLIPANPPDAEGRASYEAVYRFQAVAKEEGGRKQTKKNPPIR